MSPPPLKKGKVYRTEEFSRFDLNATRFASRLVKEGKLRRLRHGLYHVPHKGVFGEVPASESELLRALFRGEPYLRTGPSVWNTLGLGTTALEAVPLVYNTTRTGEIDLGGRRFELRRVRFPRDPDPEFFVVDLLENPERAGVEHDRVVRALAEAIASGRFNLDHLLARASQFGTRRTRQLVERASSLARDAG